MPVCKSTWPNHLSHRWKKEGIVVILVTNLHKKFKTYHALKGIDLTVKRGEIYGFIGRNGAGKSTTMNILAGLSRPTEGKCIVNGKDVSKIQHPSDLAIGYLPEDPKFYSWMTAREILDYLGNCGDRPVTKTQIREILDWVALEKDADRRVGGYSRGMRQRLGIATALIKDPELLIFDEPSSALDPEGRSDVLRLITELKQMGKTVLFSTHILSDVERICDTVGIIVSGKLTMQRPLAEIQKDLIVPVYDIILEWPPEQSLMEALRGLDSVKHVAANGNSLSVTTRDEKRFSVDLMEFFASRRIPVNSFSLRKNDLEDIFIQEVNGK
jgi:ABC-2 type transport system ATP-binding protein